MPLKLVATYKLSKPDDVLGGPKSATFIYEAEFGTTVVEIDQGVTVEQGSSRRISTSIPDADTDCVEQAFGLIESVEQLIMLFEGTFVPIVSAAVTCRGVVQTDCSNLCNRLLHDRLSFYRPADFLEGSIHRKLIDWASVLDGELFSRFLQLKDDMGLAYQVFLYAQGRGLVADVRVAFLVELAEPMVELCKSRSQVFGPLRPGSRGTTLTDCINALVIQFGRDIFSNEIESDLTAFASKAKDSRVRVMHIKKDFDGRGFKGRENICYSVVFILLYRKILLDLLGLSTEIDYAHLAAIVARQRQWLAASESHCDGRS